MFPSVARFLALILVLALSHASNAQSSSESGTAGVVPDRDRLLLEKIDRLEQRIAELETRLGIDSAAKQPDSPASASGKLNQEAAQPATGTSAANSSAAPTEAEAPFAFADFSWLNGNSRTKESPLDSKVFTGEFRADISYIYDLNHPQDHTLSGTSESGRTGEFQVQQLGVGGDFHYGNVRGRVMTQFGMYSTMTPVPAAANGT